MSISDSRPPVGRPPWFPWVVGIGGGVAFAVALFLIVANLGPGGRAAAPTTTTSPGPTTTVPVTETTVPPSTTTVGEATTTTTPLPATTTTGAAPLVEDRFEGASLATPLFPPEINTFDFVEGSGRLTAHTPGTLPVMYEVDVGDMRLSFRMNADEGTEPGRYGAFILGEDPADGVMEHWVGVWLDPALSQIVVVTFADDRFGASWLTEATGDAAFGFGEWIEIVVIYSAGTVTVEIDAVTAMVVDIEFDADHGYVGFGMYAGGPGDRLHVDDFVVEVAGG